MSDAMILCERHVIKKNHVFHDECDHLTFLAKNLYNATLYYQRYSFFNKDFKSYYDVNRVFTHSNQKDYRALPSKVSKQVQMLVDKSFKSYFALVKKKVNGDYSSSVRIPKYLNKTSGRYVVPYPKDALSLKNEGFVKLTKTNIIIKTNVSKKNIQGARIVPKGNHFVIEILYKATMKPLKSDKPKRVAFVDPGLNNLMTVTSNYFNPLIYNGKPLKSINQLSNKNIAALRSKLSERGLRTSSLVQSVHTRRTNRLTDLLHKITTQLVNHLDSYNIDTVIFGHNIGQKQDINLGKVTNQNFVQIPYTQLMQLLKYKCELRGIRFIETEESYTSKCSFLDEESICKHSTYQGNRTKRGLFQTSNGTLINADVNGSLNIGRKYLTKLNMYTKQLHEDLVRFMVNPRVVTIRQK
jgi:transposase, IS605 orfB family